MSLRCCGVHKALFRAVDACCYSIAFKTLYGFRVFSLLVGKFGANSLISLFRQVEGRLPLKWAGLMRSPFFLALSQIRCK